MESSADGDAADEVDGGEELMLETTAAGTEIETTAAENDKKGQVYRGNLLELAQFLTMFRSYYTYTSDEATKRSSDQDNSNSNNSIEGDVVTPHDIEMGLKFRYYLQQKQHMLDEKYSLEAEAEAATGEEGDASLVGEDTVEAAANNNSKGAQTERGEGKDQPISNVPLDEYSAARWNRLQQMLQEQETYFAKVETKNNYSNKRGEQMHRLLQRFEVWSSKDLAHTLFMPSCNNQSPEEAALYCWSKILHLPGAAYFADRSPTETTNAAINVADGDKDVGTSSDLATNTDSNTDNSGPEPGIVQQEEEGKKPAAKESQQQTKGVPVTKFSATYAQAHPAEHPMCSLVLPPNVHTWEEYARIADMFASLPTEQSRNNARDSHCTGAIKTIQSMGPSTTADSTSTTAADNKKSNIYAGDYNFKPHDLMALWVRAQRDTVARRHLIQMFTCNSCNDNDGGHQQQGELPVPNNNCNTKVGGKFQLQFVGNYCPSTKRRVLAESALVDRLVEWCVKQHVFFHYHFVCQQLSETKEDTRSKASSLISPKRALDGSKETSPKSVKRPRTEEDGSVVDGQSPARDPDILLLEDCYRYMLRWFCRRNQEKVAILYNTDQKDQKLFPSPAALFYETKRGVFWKQCVEAGMTNIIRKRLKLFASSSVNLQHTTERSFARLDRKIHQYTPPDLTSEQQESPFYLSVSNLLRAWSECVTESTINIEAAALQSVVDDWKCIYSNFDTELKTNGIQAAAATLLDIRGHGGSRTAPGVEIMVEEAMQLLLVGTNAPWHEMCAECQKGSKQHANPSSVTICTSCERAFNDSCYDPSKFKRVKIGDHLTNKLSPLAKLSVEVPQTALIPDFEGSNATQVQWTEVKLSLNRSVSASLGISMRQTEASMDAYKYIKSGELTLDELDALVTSYPIGLEETLSGCLVIKVTENGTGHGAGFRVNDVVVGLEIVSVVDKTDISTAGIHCLKNLSKEERLALLGIKCEELKVTVMRPDVDILAQSMSWVLELQEWNNSRLLSQQTFLVCEDCQNRPQTTQGTDVESIRKEALNCRAVVRRISLESYAQPFEDEEIYTDSSAGVDPDICSLRRLDAMLSWIIHDNLSSSEEQHPPTAKAILLQNSFFKPSWHLSARARLDWAPVDLEKKPAELFLAGMGILLRRKRTASSQHSLLPTFERQKLAFLSHFIHLQLCWGHFAPPESAIQARAPWPSKSCSTCFARAGTLLHNGQPICKSALCIRRVEETNMLGRKATYKNHARLVGSSILVFPDDPLLLEVNKAVRVDSAGRPVEFIVAFFFPPIQIKEEGTFLLFPVATQRQLRYLLEHCSTLKQPETLSSKEDFNVWIEESILGLPGVLQLSSSALVSMIATTIAFETAVGEEIKAFAQTGSVASAPIVFHGTNSENSETVVLCTSVCTSLESEQGRKMDEYLGGNADQGCRVLSSLFHSFSPTIRLMILATDKSTRGDDGDAMSVENFCSAEVCSWTGEPRLKGSQELTKSHLEDKRVISIDSFSVPPTGGDFAVVYSDLYNLQRAFHEMKVPLLRSHRLELSQTIVLLRPNTAAQDCDTGTPSDYKGVGWGFELLKWKHDGRLRVGRVHPQSPAFKCGLRMHDSILAINGRGIGHKSPWSLDFLVSAILASPLSKPADDLAVGPERVLLTSSAVLERLRNPVRGPVVLTLRRAQAIPTIAPTIMTHAETSPLNVSRQRSDGEHAGEIVDASLQRTTTATSPTRELGHSRSLLINIPVIDVDAEPDNYGEGKEENATRAKQRRILGDSGMLALSKLTTAEALATRRPMTVSAFYMACAIPHSVLSQIEASVLLEAIGNRPPLPMLGLRMLCPRYTLETCVEQVKHFSNALEHLAMVPKLQPSLWKMILAADYNRYQSEPGDAPAIFVDRPSCSFSLPRDKLPLDRMVEDAFRRNLVNQRIRAPQQLQEPHSQSTMQTNHHRLAPLPYYQNAQEHQGNQFDPPERIRGGGHDSPSTVPPSLDMLDVAEWNYTLVSYCEEGDEEEGRYILGYVQMEENHSKNVNDFEEVAVALFYDTKRGVFDCPKVVSIDPFDLATVPEGSERAREVAKIEDQFGILAKMQLCSVNGTIEELRAKARQDAPLGVVNATEDALQLETNDASLNSNQIGNSQDMAGDDAKMLMQSIKFQEVSSKLMFQMLGQTGGPSSSLKLGALVDGRYVLWLHSDPLALYIQLLSVEHSSSPLAGKAFRECIAKQNRLRSPKDRLISSTHALHYCLWGCRFETDDSEDGFELVHFPSAVHLRKHNNYFHSYTSKTAQVGSLTGFSRVASTDGLQSLERALGSAACARSAQLTTEAEKAGQAEKVRDPSSGDFIVCSPSRDRLQPTLANLFDVVSAGEAVDDDEMLGKIELTSRCPSHQPAVLLLKIKLLFELKKGTLHLSQGAHKSFCCIQPKKGEGRVPVLPCGSLCSDSIGIAPNRECHQCSLCTLDAEEVLQLNTMEQETDTSKETQSNKLPTYSYHGIGCAIAGNSLVSDDFTKAQGGHLTFGKKLLLHVTQKIPQQLHTVEAEDLQDTMRKNKNNFRQFVNESLSVDMLAQAFVVVLTSVEQTRLPLWWSGAAGWSSSALILLNSSRSKASLILHLLLFDVALTEYLQTAFEATPLKNLNFSAGVSSDGDFKDNLVEARMKVLLEAGDNTSIRRYHDGHELHCSICEDGGSLLCCEFCPGVAHPQCCTPPVQVELDHWCCASCVASLKEIQLISHKTGK